MNALNMKIFRFSVFLSEMFSRAKNNDMQQLHNIHLLFHVYVCGCVLWSVVIVINISHAQSKKKSQIYSAPIGDDNVDDFVTFLDSFIAFVH